MARVVLTALQTLEPFIEAAFSFPYFDVPHIGRPVDVLVALACGLVRLMSGEFVASGLEQCARPKGKLVLYDFEACPYCRKVREALDCLGLDVEVRPCPKPSADGASRFRAEVRLDDGSPSKFPVLVDDDGTIIRESEVIVDHLWSKYGASARAPWNYRVGRWLDRTPWFFVALFFRPLPRCGWKRLPSKAPPKPLVYYGYEPSPFAKLVRERLCVLELPYKKVSIGHGSKAKRADFAAKYGDKMTHSSTRQGMGVIQVPCLVDPNVSEDPIFESSAIVKLLQERYGAAEGEEAAKKAD